MAPPLLTLDEIRLSFGGEPLLEGASLEIEPRARIALVGRNGSGKSTLLKIAAGLVEPDCGTRYLDPGATVAYLPQEPDLTEFKTVADYVGASLDTLGAHGVLPRLYEEFGITPEAKCVNLSGGEARRAALARIFAIEPDILLLDEPTNHLDLPAIELLEGRLAASRASILLISHDRRFLERLTQRTVWIDRGVTRSINEGFAKFEEWRDKILQEEESQAHKLDRKIVAEEHWVRYGVTARRKRNVRRMRELAELRIERRERKKTAGTVSFSVNQATSSGKRVIVADEISKRFDAIFVVKNFSIEIGRGDRVGIVGPNGAGKTTLLKMLTGQLPPDDGAVSIGANVEMISLDQKRESLAPDARVADAITDGRSDWVTFGGQNKHVATYLKEFLFKPEQWRTPVTALSGGERGRLALAAALAKPSNLIVLDEPTNDLDIETLDLLEEMIADYAGTAIIVSHDRSFLDRTVTSIIAPDTSDRDGVWTEYSGGYTDMITQRGEAPGPRTLTEKPASKRSENESPKTQSVKSKLSFKEKYALENLPTKIAALNDEIHLLKIELADPKLFTRNAKIFNEKAERLTTAEAELAASEDEWLMLEMKRETLEQS
ncbi:MAG: ABC-F family ATP-binding cassette domain-containing protein [Parvularculaceae bacterium]